MWKIILLAGFGFTVIIAIALVFGSSHWQSATKEMHRSLDAKRLIIGVNKYSPTELIGLPKPVQKYFRTVLKDG